MAIEYRPTATMSIGQPLPYAGVGNSIAYRTGDSQVTAGGSAHHRVWGRGVRAHDDIVVASEA